LPSGAIAQTRVRQVRAFEDRMSGDNRPYNHATIPDPTGNAPERRVERFELRGGDCSNPGDCTQRPLNGRMVARTRVERVLDYTAREGDEGLLRYHVFLPQGDYSIVDSVGSTMGQLLWAFRDEGRYDGFPIFSLDTAWGYRGRLEAVATEMRTFEDERLKYANYPIGSLYDGLLGQWLQVDVRFRLSSGRDGYVAPSVNGRALGRLTGRTMLDDGWLQVRYGIYQTGTNQYPAGADAIPTQVAYFAGVGLYIAV
jgi:hypothetical protein